MPPTWESIGIGRCPVIFSTTSTWVPSSTPSCTVIFVAPGAGPAGTAAPPRAARSRIGARLGDLEQAVADAVPVAWLFQPAQPDHPIGGPVGGRARQPAAGDQRGQGELTVGRVERAEDRRRPVETAFGRAALSRSSWDSSLVPRGHTGQAKPSTLVDAIPGGGHQHGHHRTDRPDRRRRQRHRLRGRRAAGHAGHRVVIAGRHAEPLEKAAARLARADRRRGRARWSPTSPSPTRPGRLARSSGRLRPARRARAQRRRAAAGPDP